MTRRGWALFAAMAVIWGIPYLLIKIAVGQLTPASLVFLRTALGAALLLPVAAARGWLTPLLPYWRWVLIYTVVEVSLPWFLLADGERRLSSSLTGLMIAAVPLLAAVLQMLTRGDEVRLESGSSVEMLLQRPLDLDMNRIDPNARNTSPTPQRYKKLEKPATSSTPGVGIPGIPRIG